MLVIAAVCVLAQIVAILRPSRGDSLSAAFAGVLSAGTLIGAVYSVVFTPLGCIGALMAPPIGFLALLPLAATIVYFNSARQEMRACDRARVRFGPLGMLLGFLLPLILGWSALKIAHRIEARIVASYIDTETPADSSRLERFRSVAWLHDWPELKGIYRSPWTSDADQPRSDRRERAGAAWAALTGMPATALDPSLD